MGQPLTQERVDTITLQQGRKLIADAGCKGLYLDVRPTGKSWRYRRTDATGNFTLGNPVQRGHRFQRKADSNPVIADSR